MKTIVLPQKVKGGKKRNKNSFANFRVTSQQWPTIIEKLNKKKNK